MVKTLRVGLVGAGDISKYHLRAWQATAGANVVAVCDLDKERARARSDQFGIPGRYDDVRAMLKEERLDALDIATWRDTHVDLIRMAAAAGLDVLCQKPVASSLEEAEAIEMEVGSRVRVMVNENRRFGPQYRTIGSWIRDGKIGRVTQGTVIGYRSSLIRREDGTRPAVERAVHYGRERRLMIAGALTHQIDVMRYLLGSLTVVAARTLTTEPDLPGETVATILLETASGAPVVISGNAVAPGFGDSPSAGDAGDAPPGERMEIIGEHASVIVCGETLDRIGPSPARESVDQRAAYQACFDGAVAHFVERLADGRPFETDLRDNLETLRLVEQAYRLSGAH
jgi:predicted dehydrogenase